MCGIVALLSPEHPLDRAPVARAMAALAHRGPDGSGMALLHRDRVALAHTRLALVDVSGGAQPIASEDGSVVAVVSGELYGDARLRAELEARGHRFRTRSDSELCVHGYEEYGDALVTHLRGEFAFAIWDERRARLLCARDRFGVRPLCWARLPDGVVALASEAKALFALGVRPRWDADALWFAANAQYTPADATLFEGVAQVPPGHWLVADARGVTTRRYWDLDLPVAADKREVTPGRVRAALEEAVTERLRGDVPVACQLSGGLDSSFVAALAARARTSSAGPLDCFGLSFTSGGDDYDEIAIARRTAAHIGAELHAVPVDDEALWGALPAAVAAGEGLAINLHLPAKFLLSRAIRDAGYRVVLTGEGADEVLLGYPHFRRDLLGERGLSDAALASANGPSAGIMMPAGGAMLSTDAMRDALGFVPSWVLAKAALGHRVTSLLARDLLERFAGRDAYGEMAASFAADALRGRERVDQASYGWCKLALTNYILRTLGDGMEMAHSVEGRLPFLDHHFFELARSIPTAQKIRQVEGEGMIEKHVLREAARSAGELLPEEVLRRRKHPLLAPPSLGRSRAAGARVQTPVQDWLRSADVPAFVDRRALGRTLDAIDRSGSVEEAERQLWDPAIMTLVTATLLHTHYRMELP